MEADTTRTLIRREYKNVYARLRKLFKIPKDEIVTKFYWDKDENSLVLLTLKD